MIVCEGGNAHGEAGKGGDGQRSVQSNIKSSYANRADGDSGSTNTLILPLCWRAGNSQQQASHPVTEVSDHLTGTEIFKEIVACQCSL